MKTNYRLFSIFGIPIYLGWTVFLLPIISIFFFFDPELSTGWWIPAVAFSVIIPVSFTWHELGHAWMVRAFKKTVDSLEISVLGGTTRYAEADLTPKQLAWVYVMGLIHTFILLVIATIPYAMKWVQVPKEMGAQQGWEFFIHITWFINGFIFIFNLIQAQPYDMGKVIFHTIRSVKNDVVAQIWSTRLATIVAIACVGLGLYTSEFMFYLLAAIIFFNSRVKMRVIRGQGNVDEVFQEYQDISNKEMHQSTTQLEKVIREPKVILYSNEFVSRVQEYIKDAVEEVFLVIDAAKKPMGFVWKVGLVDPDRSSLRIEMIMNSWAQPLNEITPLNTEMAIAEMDRIESPMLPIMHHGKLLGVVYKSDLLAE